MSEQTGIYMIKASVKDEEPVYLCTSPFEVLHVPMRINHREPLLFTELEVARHYIRRFSSGTDLPIPPFVTDGDRLSFQRLFATRGTVVKQFTKGVPITVFAVRIIEYKEVVQCSYEFVPYYG